MVVVKESTTSHMLQELSVRMHMNQYFINWQKLKYEMHS